MSALDSMTLEELRHEIARLDLEMRRNFRDQQALNSLEQQYNFYSREYNRRVSIFEGKFNGGV